MKQFAAAILTLWLAVDVLGIPAPEMEEPRTTRRPSLPSSGEPEVYLINRFIGCCYYEPQKFNCNNLKNFYKNTNDCPYEGMIFVTKKDTKVCANPKDKKVKQCINNLLPNYIRNFYDKAGRKASG